MATLFKERDLGWNKLLKLFGIKALRFKVGVQGDQAAVEHEAGEDLTNVELASIHEFGSEARSIPARSFLRSTFDERERTYSAALQFAVEQEQPTERKLRAAVREVAEQYRTDVIAKIKGGISPAWAPSTQLQKEREGKEGDVPLWDTGRMVSSIAVEEDRSQGQPGGGRK